MVQDTAVVEFGRAIESRYLGVETVAYHNCIHGADVTQTVHALLVSGELGNRVTKLDILCLLIAAVSHDVGASCGGLAGVVR